MTTCPHCGQTRRPEMARILAVACDVMDVTREDLLAYSRVIKVAVPRQITMLVMLKAGHSLSAIGRFLGRDHTTIMHGCKAAEERVTNNSRRREQYQAILARIADKLGYDVKLVKRQ